MTEIVADLCNNHMGDLRNAKKMIEVCYHSGCSYVKFQKRNIGSCYTASELRQPRPSPWGKTYGDYRYAVEFDYRDYDEVDRFCKTRIPWFATPYDIDSLDFLGNFGVPFIKVASASMTDFTLLDAIRSTGKAVILSTGMCTWPMVDKAIEAIGRKNIYAILHCVGTYPNTMEELNLKCIPEMKYRYPFAKIGFSNHHPSILPSVMAVAMGAEMVEFHMTMDRTWYGSDQSASLEPQSIWRLTTYINNIPKMMGEPEKYISEREKRSIERLRFHQV